MALAITKTVEQELSLLTLMIILTALRFASNNTAEYEALIAGLQLARDMGATDINRISDSQLSIRSPVDSMLTSHGPVSRSIT